MINNKFLFQFLLLALLLIAQGCALVSRVSVYPLRISQTSLVDLNSSRQQIQEKLNRAYRTWQGTPYGYGKQQAGIAADCSGFTQSVFKNQLAINLPRTTRAQINIGQKVDFKNAKTGDLVFFNLKNGYGHVGIYLGNQIVMQATTSQGVTKTNLKTSDWWAERVFMVKRIIN